MYSAKPDDFATLARDGFTLVGPWYISTPERTVLDRAHAAGLGVIFPVGVDQATYSGSQGLGDDGVATSATIAAQVAAVRDHPALQAWYLMPEELRPWHASEVAYVRDAVATIRAADGLHRPILTYQPNHRGAGDLAPIMGQLDISTKGMYANYAGYRRARAWIRWSVDQLRQSSSAGTPWAVLEMFEDPPTAEAGDIASWVSHDVYASLLSGARGVLVYSGWRRPGFASYDRYRQAYAEVATALNGAEGLASVFLQGARCPLRQAKVVDGPQTVAFHAGRRTEQLPSLLHAEIRHGGFDWLWLVNSADAPIVVALSPMTEGKVVVGAGQFSRVDSRVWLAPWAVVGWRARVQG